MSTGPTRNAAIPNIPNRNPWSESHADGFSAAASPMSASASTNSPTANITTDMVCLRFAFAASSAAFLLSSSAACFLADVLFLLSAIL